MRLHGALEYLLAFGLSYLAGCIDALGFLELHGLFVSFMSGNSTRMAVGLVGDGPAAVKGALLILAFVVGVGIGALVGGSAGARRKPVVLLGVALLLFAAAALFRIGQPHFVVTLVMAVAIGFANNVFLYHGEVSIGVTYMTGALVKFGQHLAAVLHGEAPFAWLPYLLLWASLIAGALTGALCYPPFGLGTLWGAAIFALVLFAGSLVPRRH